MLDITLNKLIEKRRICIKTMLKENWVHLRDLLGLHQKDTEETTLTFRDIDKALWNEFIKSTGLVFIIENDSLLAQEYKALQQKPFTSKNLKDAKLYKLCLSSDLTKTAITMAYKAITNKQLQCGELESDADTETAIIFIESQFLRDKGVLTLIKNSIYDFNPLNSAFTYLERGNKRFLSLTCESRQWLREYYALS